MFVNKCPRLYERTGLPVANKAKMVLLVTKLLSYINNHSMHVILIDPTTQVDYRSDMLPPQDYSQVPESDKSC